MRNVVFSSLRQAFIPRWLGAVAHQGPGVTSTGFSSFQKGLLQLRPFIQQRTATTRTKIHLGEPSQREIELERPPIEHENENPVYPAMVQQAYDNMRKFDKCVLLTRVGSFYEVGYVQLHHDVDFTEAHKLYLDQADKYGPLLNLKVAQKKTAAGMVSMVQVSA